MGSSQYHPTIQRGGRPGKINAPLNQLLQQVKWGEYKLGDLFTSQNGNVDIQKQHINGIGEYVVSAGVANNGIIGKSDVPAKIFAGNTITIDMFGNAFYRAFSYKMVTHARVFSLIPLMDMNTNTGLLITTCLSYLKSQFGYENMCSWEKIKDSTISLPVTSSGEIAFAFIDHFIAELEAERLRELEAYLQAAGLTDYHLTTDEQKALQRNNIAWKKFTFSAIFNKIVQGRRLKKDDQIPGNLPFVMAGVTNTGVVNHIANPLIIFPKNSITIDIFGNTFYRNYEFGAGDDTGVYWNDHVAYSSEIMLFFATSMGQTLRGKFSFGKKLRSSQSFDFTFSLPITPTGEIDFAFMETFISAIKKQVIRGVVCYADRKIAATQQVIAKPS